MGNALQALIAGLAGAGRAGVNYYGQKRETERATAERDEARRVQQEQWDRQFGLQQSQFDAGRADAALREGRESTEFTNAQADRNRTLARGQAEQYGLHEALPADLAAAMRESGLRTNTTVEAGKPLGLSSFNASVPTFGLGDPSAGAPPSEVVAKPLPMPTAVGMGSVTDKRGFKTADEVTREELEKAIASAPPEVAAMLRATQGKVGGSITGDMVKTPEQRAAELRARGDEEIRINNAQADAQGRNRPQADPLVTVIGPDGKTPILVPRSQAAGMTPAKVATPSAGGGDDGTKTLTLLEEARSVLKDIDPKHPGFSSAVGAGWQSVPFVDAPPAGTAGAGYKARLDRFKALNVLPRLSVMKGLGQMSNIEFGTVEKGSTDLDPTLPEADFKRLYDSTVIAIEKAYNRARGGTNILNDPDGDGVPNAATGGRASGAGPAGGGMVEMVHPDGSTLRVPLAEVAAAEAAGAKRKGGF